MCDHSLDLTIERILADELVQLAMASDGVTEPEMQRLLEQARQAIRAEAAANQRCSPAKCSTPEIA